MPLDWHPADLFDPSQAKIDKWAEDEKKKKEKSKPNLIFGSGHLTPKEKCSCGCCPLTTDPSDYCCLTLYNSPHLLCTGMRVRDYFKTLDPDSCITKTPNFVSTFLNETVIRACAITTNYYGKDGESRDTVTSRCVDSNVISLFEGKLQNDEVRMLSPLRS